MFALYVQCSGHSIRQLQTAPWLPLCAHHRLRWVAAADLATYLRYITQVPAGVDGCASVWSKLSLGIRVYSGLQSDGSPWLGWVAGLIWGTYGVCQSVWWMELVSELTD